MPNDLGPTAAILAVVSLTRSAVAAPPVDNPGEHRERIRTSQHAYTVRVGGCVDGAMTRDPIGYGGWRQTFEPNREVVLTNYGPAVVRNPWLVINDRGHWRSLESLVQHLVAPEMSDADKARTLWEWHRHHRFHSSTGTAESSNAIKAYNVYGYTLCGDDSVVVADLWRAAGLKVRSGKPQGHSTTEVFYDGRWHLLDGDENIICLLPDNKTIASEDEIIRDHELMKRTHTYGILRPDGRRTDEGSAALHCHQDRKHAAKRSGGRHTMSFDLRPGESMIWRWSNVHKWYGGDRYGSWKRVGERVANGQLVYEPDLDREGNRRHVGQIDGGRFATGADRVVQFQPCESGKPAYLVVRMRPPYVIVGGQVSADLRRKSGDDVATMALSFDGKTWTPIWQADRTGNLRAEAKIDSHFPRTGDARYGVMLRMALQARGDVEDAALRGFRIVLDLQMAPLTLPALTLGENRVIYTDQTSAPHEVEVTHRWVERSNWRPPVVPTIVSPTDSDKTASTRPHFRWQRPAHPDGRVIVDYQFQLGEYADMRWVLSPNFDKLIARTAYRGQIPKQLADGYEPPYDGLLNPGQVYYWRVRARDDRGVWGPWSATARFVPQGPGVPTAVRLDVDRATRTATLRWQLNPKGRPPVRYEVYGSDERGFSPSRQPYDVVMDGAKPQRRDANLIAEVETTRLPVVGAALKDARLNKVYYRVVAVDAQGVRSGPSPLAESPHPMFVSTPPGEAHPGRVYEYRPRVTRSIGHLVGYTANNTPYNYAFRWGDALTFTMPEGPSWLMVDDKTGRLHGTPPASAKGPVRVTLRVTSILGGEDRQSFQLRIAR